MLNCWCCQQIDTFFVMSGSEAIADAELLGMNCCASEAEINGICNNVPRSFSQVATPRVGM